MNSPASTDLQQAMDGALERGKLALETEPRATSARYDRQLDRVIVDLTDGGTFSFSPRMAQGLEAAASDQLAKVEILGLGYGLHWEALDVDLSLPGLMAGMLGTKAYMATALNRTPMDPRSGQKPQNS